MGCTVFVKLCAVVISTCGGWPRAARRSSARNVVRRSRSPFGAVRVRLSGHLEFSSPRPELFLTYGASGTLAHKHTAVYPLLIALIVYVCVRSPRLKKKNSKRGFRQRSTYFVQTTGGAKLASDEQDRDGDCYSYPEPRVRPRSGLHAALPHADNPLTGEAGPAAPQRPPGRLHRPRPFSGAGERPSDGDGVREGGGDHQRGEQSARSPPAAPLLLHSSPGCGVNHQG